MSASGSGRARVYRMSADRLLGSLPAGSIDVLVTDPPYTTVDRHRGSGHLRDWFRGGMNWRDIGRVLTLARRKMKPGGVAFVMTNGDGLKEAIAALERAGFIGIRTITWDRRWPGLGNGLRHQTEFILLGRLLGSRPVSGVDIVSVSAVGPGTADRYPTEKPAGLGRELARIAGVRRGDLVVDPFCGSGALLVGAFERGATVVGGDISARAVSRATARLIPPRQPGLRRPVHRDPARAGRG
jgi:site-specific DNA-methyltransferase (adenine-specific)